MSMRCSNCGERAKIVTGNYLFKESGLDWVTLVGIKMVKCPHCGNQDPIISRPNDLMRVVARAIIHKPYRLTGKEVRFLRKHLGMTAEKFSHLLDVDKTTVSKWENDDDKVGAQSDRLIRLLSTILDPNLRTEQQKAVELLPRIKGVVRHPCINVNTQKMRYEYAVA